ncbi:MAG TPA: ABC transporter permease [bacterium]|nr:ABC transporter permease [bacterium]HPN45880.1 ABC transporter permease [bacterium]
MLTNFLKIAFRTIQKQKLFTFINIIGMTIGLTTALLILLWIQDELSIDKYHKNKDRICQAYLKVTQEEQSSYQSTTAPIVATLLKDEYPEVEETARVGGLPEVVLKSGETRILESGGIAADPALFKILTFPFLSGDPTTAMENPESIILTASMARKYFGDANPLGQVLRYNNEIDLQVTGVVNDIPKNSFYTFDFVVPFTFLKKIGYDTEGSLYFPCSYLTFVLVKPGVDFLNLSDKVQKRTIEANENVSFEIMVKPFKEVYLFETGGKTRLVIFGLIALIILGIVCINFINLTMAQVMTRAKEIGIRKVAGAIPRHIVQQFLGEAVILTGMATVLAVILVNMFLGLINEFTGKVMTVPYTNPLFILELLGIIVFTGLLAGIYPAVFMSRYNPLQVINQRLTASRRMIMRKVLIITQFVFSIVFIIATLVISGQMRYVQNFNLGVNEDNVLYIAMDDDMQTRYTTLKQELLQNPRISHVTTASNLPIAIRSGSFYRWGKDDDKSRRICETSVGYDFIETFAIEMAEGRFFSEQYPGDLTDAIVVNESAIKAVGLESPVGKPFLYRDKYYTLIGIIKDFQHNKSLQRAPDPLSFVLDAAGNNYLFVKIDPTVKDIAVLTETVNFIRKTCDPYSPERPLTYQYLNEFAYDFVKTQQMMGKILFYASLMAIFISCLGLFGLTAFLNRQRTKEFGIRKALGASLHNFLLKSSGEYSLWIFIANIIAWPIAWYAMHKWLENFAYRINLSWWIFLLAGFMALVIALLTVGGQAYRAARTNPVEALRYE